MQPFRKIMLLLILLQLPFACLHLAAQNATSQVTGIVTDLSGAVVGGAEVRITNTDTNAIRTTTPTKAANTLFPTSRSDRIRCR